MGQQYSFVVKVLHDHALVLKDLAVLNQEGLASAVEHLNKTLKTFAEGGDHYIVFAIKEPSDESYPYLWKATTRIICYKVRTYGGNVESERVMDVRQFCKLYRNITRQLRHTRSVTDEDWEKVDCEGETCVSCPVKLEEVRESLCASMIFTRVDEAAADKGPNEECCICMDQKAEVILACVHCFCKTCIDRWSDVNNTCPICRNEIHGNKDYWEVPEAPSKGEIEQFVMGLAEGAGAPT
ncbi:RING finger protein 141-like isoform X1 [Orbicella faveolata]|uniref:RING finger protein 141-like isoform X1 n=1 Tax=Orbicella faveolata TaxID=48498 RepID=UPI0009E4A5DF|nr:RING finger protein 141-like isoform X1 [Orbicella faveolata]